MSHQITDLAYNETQGLDLYLVDEPGRPLVVCLHGGGFISGERNDERCKQSAELLTKAGNEQGRMRLVTPGDQEYGDGNDE